MAEDSEGESWVCGALVPVPGDSDQQQRHLCDQGSHGWPKGEPHIAGTAAGGSYGCCPRGVSASPNRPLTVPCSTDFPRHSSSFNPSRGPGRPRGEARLLFRRAERAFEQIDADVWQERTQQC